MVGSIPTVYSKFAISFRNSPKLVPLGQVEGCHRVCDLLPLPSYFYQFDVVVVFVFVFVFVLSRERDASVMDREKIWSYPLTIIHYKQESMPITIMFLL